MARVKKPIDGSIIDKTEFADPLIDDYVSKTDTAAQEIVSNLTLAGTVNVTGALQKNGGAVELQANKAAANGYCPLDSTSKVPTANLGTSTADSTKFLRGDRVWAVPPAGGGEGGGGLPLFDAVIYFDGSYFRAKDENGTIQFSASYVGGLINDCISAGLRAVLIKASGTLTVDEKILLNQPYCRLAAVNWRTELRAANSLNDHVIEVTGDESVIENLKVDGNKSYQTTGHCIYNHSNNSRFIDLNVENARLDNFHNGEASWNSDTMGGWLYGGRFATPQRHNIYMDYTATDWQVLNGPLVRSAESADCAGIVCDGDNVRFDGLHAWGNYHNLILAPAHSIRGVQFINCGWMDNLGSNSGTYPSHNIIHKSRYTVELCDFYGGTVWRKNANGSAVYTDGFHMAGNGPFRLNKISMVWRGNNESFTKQGNYAINGNNSNVANNTVVGNTVGYFRQSSPFNINTETNEVTSNTFYSNGV